MMINPKNLTRGSIWLVNLDPIVGNEQAKKRPCVVISATSYNQGFAKLVIVIPITSRKRDYHWYVQLDSASTGLNHDSYAICDKMRSVSLLRFSSGCIGFVNDYAMKLIEDRLKVLLYLME